MTRANATAEWSRLMFNFSRLWADASMVVTLRVLAEGGQVWKR